MRVWALTWKAGDSFDTRHWHSDVYINVAEDFFERMWHCFGQEEELVKEKMNLARKWKQHYGLLQFVEKTLKELLQLLLTVWKHVNWKLKFAVTSEMASRSDNIFSVCNHSQHFQLEHSLLTSPADNPAVVCWRTAAVSASFIQCLSTL